jgi:DNA-binding transcriptional LysR family regulator
MNIIDLESFVTVVDSGSIVAAAAKLHLTQSAVTRRVQSLEEALGVSLLDRQTRPLQLTTAGKATYESAKPVLSSVDDLKSAVIHDGEPSGSFRFGVVRGLGEGVLTGPIEALTKEFPLLGLQAYSQWSNPLLDKIRARALDVAAILLPEGDVPPANIESEFLGKQSFVVVGPKTANRAQPTTLKELSTKGWILSPEGCGVRSAVESALLHQRLPFQIAVEAEGKNLQLSLVRQGIGLGVVPPQVLHAFPSRKHLSVIRVKDFAPVQDLWLIRAKHIAQEARVVKSLRRVLQNFILSGKGKH